MGVLEAVKLTYLEMLAFERTKSKRMNINLDEIHETIAHQICPDKHQADMSVEDVLGNSSTGMLV